MKSKNIKKENQKSNKVSANTHNQNMKKKKTKRTSRAVISKHGKEHIKAYKTCLLTSYLNRTVI